MVLFSLLHSNTEEEHGFMIKSASKCYLFNDILEHLQ